MMNNVILFLAAAFFCAWSAPQAQDVSLRYAGFVKDGRNSADGLYSVNKVTAGPDGRRLYTT
jgi:hypothetical protein